MKEDNERILHNIFYSVQDGISVIDKDMNILQVNHVMQRWCANAMPVIGKKCYKAFYDRDERCDICPLSKAIKTGKTAHKVIPFKKTDSRAERWLDLFCIPFIDHTTGQVQGVIEYIRNITGHKVLSKALQDSQEALRSLLNATNETLLLIDTKGIILIANETIAQVLGKTVQELIGTFILDYFPPDVADHRKQQIGKVVLNGKPIQFEDKRAGRYFDIYANPVFDKEEKVSKIAIFARDITKHKNTEEELNKSRDHLEQLIAERTAELKAQFINMQELNTTLKVLLRQREEDKKEMEEQFVSSVKYLIMPYIEKIKNSRLDSRQRSYLSTMETNLNEIVGPFISTVQQLNLSPREIQVASYIKDGKTTKEIAEIMGVAASSVDSYRNSIRFKLGLNRKKTNLQSYFQSLK
jgi:PAS domain S-box-containing protein